MRLGSRTSTPDQNALFLYETLWRQSRKEGAKRRKGSNRQSIALVTMRSFSLAVALLGSIMVCRSSAFATPLAGGAIHR